VKLCTYWPKYDLCKYKFTVRVIFRSIFPVYLKMAVYTHWLDWSCV